MQEEKSYLKVLQDHKHIYDRYKMTGEIVNLHPHIKEEIANAYRVEHPNYYYNKACPICVIEMLETVYQWYEKTH